MARPDEPTTDKVAPDLPPRSAAFTLGVMDDRGLLRVTLPSGGSLVIGRSAEADVRVEHRSVSRRHARVTLGEAVVVEDLGSANGTRVRERPLSMGERAEVKPGEVFFVGEAPCFLEGGAGDLVGRLWTPGRLYKKLDALRASGNDLALLRVQTRGRPHERFESLLLDVAGAEATVASLEAGSDAFVLLVGRGAGEVEAITALLRERLGGGARAVRVGSATYPDDGADAAALAAHTKRALEDEASAAGDGAAVVISPVMRALHDRLAKLARGSISVLLLGEMGVGKEVFASQLHALSPRAAKPYVKFNCAALCETLVDGELFGYEKGAFTGAAAARAGLIEAADGGTVFLDEVGELPPPVQARLLRVLEARCVRRIGATQERPVDVRFVAATNRDLAAECDAGRFRKDLFHRLAGVSLQIPPLRERTEEIDTLARRFLERAGAQARPVCHLAFTPEARAALHRHVWPGNIRELRNAVERAALLCDGAEVTPADLCLGAPSAVAASAAPRDLSENEQGDRARVVDALERTAWNQSEAARQLGMSRKAVIARIEKYGLPRPRKGRDDG